MGRSEHAVLAEAPGSLSWPSILVGVGGTVLFSTFKTYPLLNWELFWCSGLRWGSVPQTSKGLSCE